MYTKQSKSIKKGFFNFFNGSADAESKPELIAQKQHFLEFLTIPAEFLESDSDVLLSEPVLMPCGHCFNSNKIGGKASFTCPIDRQTHRKENYINSSVLKKIIQEFNESRRLIINIINQLTQTSDKNILTDKISDYLNFIHKLAMQFYKVRSPFLAKQAYENIPEEFIDSITQDIFEDPVITTHTQIYSRIPLETWLRTNLICPLTRAPLSVANYTPTTEADWRLQQALKTEVNAYVQDRNKLGNSLYNISASELDAYKTRTRLRVLRIDEIRQTKKLYEWRNQLRERYIQAGLPLDITAQFEPKVLSQFRPGWILKSEALALQIPFTENLQITQSMCQIHGETLSLYQRLSIANFQDEAAIIRQINNLQAVYQQIHFVSETFVNHHREIYQTIIRLKINPYKEEDLIFWNNKTRTCFHKHGGIEVSYQESAAALPRKYRVPTRIFELMKLVNRINILDGEETFKTQVREIKSKRSDWSNPFAFMTRKKAVNEFYAAELEHINLSRL